MCLKRYFKDTEMSLKYMPISYKITYNRKQDSMPGSLRSKEYLNQTDWSGNKKFWY